MQDATNQVILSELVRLFMRIDEEVNHKIFYSMKKKFFFFNEKKKFFFFNEKKSFFSSKYIYTSRITKDI